MVPVLKTVECHLCALLFSTAQCVRVCVICGGLVRLVIRFNQSRIFYTRQQFIPADITMQPNVLHWPHSTCPRKWWENTECVDVLINLTKGSYNLHTCFQLLLVQHLPLTVSGCTWLPCMDFLPWHVILVQPWWLSCTMLQRQTCCGLKAHYWLFVKI